MLRFVVRRWMVVAGLFMALFPMVVFSGEPPDDLLQDFCFIRTRCTTLLEANTLAEDIHRIGGQIAVIPSPKILLGWIPSDRDGLILQLDQIELVRRGEGIGKECFGASLEDRAIKLCFDLLQSGCAKGNGRLNPLKVHSTFLEHDAEAPSPRVQALARRGETRLNDPRYPHVEFANSEQMVGKVICSIFLVESDGRIDPDRYTWTADAEAEVVASATQDLLTWSKLANSHNKTLTFSLLVFPSDSVVMRQPYEPITRSSRDSFLWESIIYANLGYPSYDDSRINAYAYLTDARRTYGFDRAFNAFIVYNPQSEGAPWTFLDGKAGWGGLGGPDLVLTSTHVVNGAFGHEMGHIFYALDEYGGARCEWRFNGVYNLNAAYGNCGQHYPCFMREGAWAVCPYTAAHVGWGNLGPAPILQYPSDQIYVVSGPTTFSWSPNTADTTTWSYLRIADGETGMSVYYEDLRSGVDQFSLKGSSRVVDLPPGEYGWSVVNGGGNWSEVSSVPRTLHVVRTLPLPSNLVFGNFPNPASGTTNFFFDIPEPQSARIEIFTVLGQRVSTINHAAMAAGRQDVQFGTKGLAQGVYIYKIVAGNLRWAGKLLVTH